MFANLEQTFRWYGPNDPVTLTTIRQTGATGVVTALHHVPVGEVWPLEQIEQRKQVIRAAGLRWSVVESVNVHNSIKTGDNKREEYADKYIKSLKNLAEAGITTVCYNFMPVLDWTRTDIDYRLPGGASALRLDITALAAFDLYILERGGALRDWSYQQQTAAKDHLDMLSAQEITILTNNIMAGVPGTKEVLTIAEFKDHLDEYKSVDAEHLKQNLSWFLKAVIPEAEKFGIKMCIHPDDPPFPILGLPRVVSTAADLQYIVDACPSTSNGITFCTGSLGARPDNNLPALIKKFGKHIHFLHLRNVQREPNGSFYEAEHLGGSTDMFEVMKAVIHEQSRWEATGEPAAIPMRPDHGHKLLDDFAYDTFPGYSAIGRLKGLAELRGLEMGIKRSLFP